RQARLATAPDPPPPDWLRKDDDRSQLLPPAPDRFDPFRLQPFRQPRLAGSQLPVYIQIQGIDLLPRRRFELDPHRPQGARRVRVHLDQTALAVKEHQAPRRGPPKTRLQEMVPELHRAPRHLPFDAAG